MVLRAVRRSVPGDMDRGRELLLLMPIPVLVGVVRVAVGDLVEEVGSWRSPPPSTWDEAEAGNEVLVKSDLYQDFE